MVVLRETGVVLLLSLLYILLFNLLDLLAVVVFVVVVFIGGGGGDVVVVINGTWVAVFVDVVVGGDVVGGGTGVIIGGISEKADLVVAVVYTRLDLLLLSCIAVVQSFVRFAHDNRDSVLIVVDNDFSVDIEIFCFASDDVLEYSVDPAIVAIGVNSVNTVEFVSEVFVGIVLVAVISVVSAEVFVEFVAAVSALVVVELVEVVFLVSFEFTAESISTDSLEDINEPVTAISVGSEDFVKFVVGLVSVVAGISVGVELDVAGPIDLEFDIFGIGEVVASVE